MISRASVATEARGWLGTPFRHQARTKGLGTDCGGLVGGVAVALGIVPADWWQTHFDPRFGGYARQPAHGTLQRVLESFMARSDEPQCGDVVLMAFASEPQHVGILTDYRWGGLSIVHALEAAGKVIEHRLSPIWRSRIVAAYAYPGVA